MGLRLGNGVNPDTDCGMDLVHSKSACHRFVCAPVRLMSSLLPSQFAQSVVSISDKVYNLGDRANRTGLIRGCTACNVAGWRVCR